MKTLATLILFLFISTLVQAQTSSIDNVKMVRISEINTIKDESGNVDGYYIYYWVDKKDKKNNAYQLRVLDNNLNIVQDIPLVRPRTYYFLECAFNGEAFALLYYSTDKKSMVLQTLDKSGEKIKEVVYAKMNATERMMLDARVETDYFERLLYPRGSEGFILTRPVKESKLGYSVESYDNSLNKVWTYGTSASSKMMEMAEVKYSSDKYMVLSVLKKPNMLSKDIIVDMIILDTKSGNKVVEKTMEDKMFKYSLLGLNVDEEKDEFLLIGEYFSSKDKVFYDASQGLYLMNLKKDGSSEVKNNAWTHEIRKVASVSSKGKVEDGGFIAFHKIIRTKDGSVYAIGEMFKKTVSGAGVALSLLSGENAGMANFRIMDMVVMRFDPDFTITSFETIEKNDHAHHLPPGWETLSSNIIATYFQYAGIFDYAFSSSDAGRDRHFVSYTSSERGESNKKESYVGTIILDKGKMSTDKIQVNQKASSYFIFPAKSGYVMISEYFRKDKKLTTRLEKFDF